MKQIHIEPEFRDLIPPLSADEKSALLASLLRDGCRDPLVVWLNHGILLDGHHRHEFCTANGIEFNVVEKHFDNKNAAMAWMIQNQFARRNITAVQRSNLALKLEPLIAEQAQNRKVEGGRRGGEESGAARRGESKDVQIVAQASRGPRTREIVAKVAGVSHYTISKVKAVNESGNAQLARDMADGKVSISEAYAKLKNLQDRKPPVSPKAVENQFNNARKLILDMAGTCGLIESPEAKAVMAAIEKVEKAFSKFSRSCAAAWKTQCVRSGDESDE